MKESDILNGLILSLGRSEYTVRELKELSRPFGITDSSIRTWLSRKVKQGFLSVRKAEKTSFYRLSEKGGRISSNISLSFKTPDWAGWDGRWWGFIFSIPEEARRERHRIRTKLSAYRFVPWYGGFWIRPRNEAEKIDLVFDAGKEREAGRLISFTPVSDITPDEVRALWKVPQIQYSFAAGLELLQREMDRLPGYSPEEAHVKRIEVGNEVVPLIYQDPLLPPVFLPENWAGENYKAAFFRWDEAAKQKARPFWAGILRKEGQDKTGR